MAEDNWQKVREIFDETLLQKPEERRKFVAEACGGDEVLRLEIESLLSSYDIAESFMETPAVAKVADVFETGTKTLEQGKCFGHYEIIEQIGKGGMGEVHLAQDTTLKRKVALKLLPTEFTDNQEFLQRFKQEAFAASSLNHPNILTIYEIGKTQNTNFIATEFIEGETLREKLRNNPLNLKEILNIAVQMSSALVTAHEAGIVHRDIKPENIMIRQDGIVKILDFGLAKPINVKTLKIDREAETKAQVKTKSGVILGTPQYMSPEQARSKKVDGRTDIWSLGVVLYEMITGNSPFEGETVGDTIAGILKTEPTPLAQTVSDSFLRFEHIVNKCLRKHRKKRYQNAKDLLVDLEDLKKELEFLDKLEKTAQPNKEDNAETQLFTAITTDELNQTATNEKINNRLTINKAGLGKALIGIFAILLISAIGLRYWYFAATKVKQIESIAVMPFVNASGDQDVEYLSDGMTETLIRSLSNIPELSVKARSSVFFYKGKEVSPKKIGEELNVQAVLLGRVIQNGEDLSLNLELVDAQTENVLWADKFDRKMSDLVSLQSQIAREVSSKLRIQLTPTEREQVAKTYTKNSEAQKLYLQGRFHWQGRNKKEFEKAIEYFKQASEKDPNYALPYTGLADTYALMAMYAGGRPYEYMPLAKKAALKALELDDNLAEAHAWYGQVNMLYDWDWEGAEREYKRAIELDSKYVWVHVWYAVLLSTKGMHDEGIREMSKTLKLEPSSIFFKHMMGNSFFWARRYDEAIVQYKEVIKLSPNNVRAFGNLANCYEMKGMYPEAMEHKLIAFKLAGETPESLQKIKEEYKKDGWRGYARADLKMELEKRKAVLARDKTAYVRSIHFARSYAHLKDKDKTLEYLNKSFDEHDYWLMFLKIEPKFDFLRDDPRFKELVKKVGIPE